MAGFDMSPEFDQAVDTLMKLYEIEGLQNGWAVFDSDLNLVDWRKDEWDADAAIGCGRCKARVPDLDGRYTAEASLIAGLVYTLLSDRNMASFEFDGRQLDVSGFVDGEKRAGYHLFGGEVVV